MESEVFRSVWDRIYSVHTGPVPNWNGTVSHRITFMSGPIWYQLADATRTGSTRSCVNTRLKSTFHSMIFDIPMRPVHEDQRHRRRFTR